MKPTCDSSSDHKNFLLIESSCKFIFFHMTSDTFSGSYDLRHFNWKVVWKTNWVNVLYSRHSAIISTVLQQVSLLEVSPIFLPFSKTKELWLKNSINFIPDLFDFRFTKLLHGISTGWPKTDYSYLIKPKIHNTKEIFKTEIFNNQL